ncbi:At5g01610-like protein [Dioscorea alata]|uniref:At5g01610-like protein n=1 Tax=Dioscorea alata TaxID=55571 RepID=A0ACB7UN83_DIOAL|nr:At5g01610-like protein [Dioscorea alata]
MLSLAGKPLLLLLLLSVAGGLALAGSPALTSNGTSIYDLLPKYGLPPGLLPDTVINYTLSEDGSFVLHLAGPCYIEFDYLVYYEPLITGTVHYGSIDDLKGIQVRRFLIWFDVDSIKVDLPPANFIYFQVGWITRKLSVGQFETVHSCRDSVLGLRRIKDSAELVIQMPAFGRDKHANEGVEKIQ